MAKPLNDKEITKLIGEANAFLKAERTKVTLLRVSGMIYFQGTFPPKPGSKRAKPYQQKIASRLPCSRQGIKKARLEAVLLGAKLVTEQFDWSDYGDRTKTGQPTIGQWVEKTVATSTRVIHVFDPAGDIQEKSVWCSSYPLYPTASTQVGRRFPDEPLRG